MRAIEFGGADNPRIHPNLDIRDLPNVDRVIDLNSVSRNNPLPIPDCSYDFVYSSYLIEHISWRTVKDFISEIYRILAPNGKVTLITANLYEQCKVVANSSQWDENFSCMIYGDMDYPENSHRFGMSPEYAIKLFKEIGFQKVDILPHPNCNTDMIIEATKI